MDVVLTGNGKFNILGGTEDAPTRLSGKITSDDKDTDLTLKEGTILLGADADISLNGYEGDVYSEFIVGGTDNTTTDVTNVTMSDGAKVSAQRVWIGGEYDKEKDTAAHTLNVTGSGTLLNGHSQIGVNIRRDGVLNVSDGGEAKASDLVVRGTITVDNAKLTANGGNVYGEGNNIPAVITVENKGVFTASGTQVFQIGHASAADRTGVLNVKNGSIVTVNNLKLEQSGSINMDYTSTLAFDTFVNSGTITIDMSGYQSGVYKLLDYTGSGSYTEEQYKALIGEENWDKNFTVVDNTFLYSSQVRMANGETVTVYANYSDAAADLEYRIGDTGDWLTYDAANGVNVSESTMVYFREQGIIDPVETEVYVAVVPMSEEVNSEVIYLARTVNNNYYEATYAFADGTSKSVKLSDNNTVEHYALPEGTTVTIVEKDTDGALVKTIIEKTPVSATTSTVPDKVVAVDDDHDNLFFAISIGKWDGSYSAQHQGDGIWGGTMEIVSTKGKNRFSTVFVGGEDATTLFLTDDANGDVFFLDDVYTANGTDARISKMTEIQAGLGNDIVDLSSAKFSYEEHNSGELIVRGGDGNDVLWGNAGHNILFGDAGNDKLYGGSNNDTLIGGIGNDVMRGGGGNDIFCYGNSYNWGNDTITQLASGSVTLYLDGIDKAECQISGNTLTWDDGTFSGSIVLNGVSWDSVKFYCDANGDGLLTEIAEYDDLKNKGAFAAVSSH